MMGTTSSELMPLIGVHDMMARRQPSGPSAEVPEPECSLGIGEWPTCRVSSRNMSWSRDWDIFRRAAPKRW